MDYYLKPTVSTLALAIVFLLNTAPAYAVKTGDSFKDWQATCDKTSEGDKGVCHIAQNLMTVDEGKQLLNIKIGYLPKKEYPIMIVTLPLGVWNPFGITLNVDNGTALKYDFETCTVQGCRVVIPVSNRFIGTMKKGRTMYVTFSNMKKVSISIPVSLRGFSKGLNRLKWYG